jgi:hypothetical protein
LGHGPKLASADAPGGLVVAVPLREAAASRGAEYQYLHFVNAGSSGTASMTPAIPDCASDIGAGVAVDLHADGDFDHARGLPGHMRLLVVENKM